MRQIVLDTETTGLSPKQGHRLIEIGCLELIDRRITQNYFHVYVNPKRPVEKGAMAVHGITNEFLDDKPLFSDVANDLLAFIQEDELIIHNASFDLGFLNHELRLLKNNHPRLESKCAILDTLSLARRMHPGQKNNLDALCKRYFVDNSNREHHGALLDSELLASVYLAMTGGQNSLLDDTDHTNTTNEKLATPHQPIECDRPLDKVNVPPHEKQAHDAFMKEIQEEE